MCQKTHEQETTTISYLFSWDTLWCSMMIYYFLLSFFLLVPFFLFYVVLFIYDALIPILLLFPLLSPSSPCSSFLFSFSSNSSAPSPSPPFNLRLQSVSSKSPLAPTPALPHLRPREENAQPRSFLTRKWCLILQLFDKVHKGFLV